MPENKIVDLTPALRTWAFRNSISPGDFRNKMGFSSYDHAYRMIARNGNHNFTHAAWGRFIWAYGLEKFGEVLKIAGVELERGHE